MNIISKHFNSGLLAENGIKVYDNINARCAFTGERITIGVLKRDLLSDVFTDYEAIRYCSDYVSVDIALLIVPVIRVENGLNSLRNYSFLATEHEFRLLKKRDLLSVIENPPNIPFALVITLSGKKHIAHKARVNFSTSIFYVSTDKGMCEIESDSLNEFLSIAKKWYTVFTKDEILHGSKNQKRIQEYGIVKYILENEQLQKYRGSIFADVVCFCLSK